MPMNSPSKFIKAGAKHSKYFLKCDFKLSLLNFQFCEEKKGILVPLRYQYVLDSGGTRL